MMGINMIKGHRSQLEGAFTGQTGDNQSVKIMILSYNPSNAIGNHESVLMGKKMSMLEVW